MDEDPGRRRAPQEGLLPGAGRRAGARREGLRHGLGGQHGGHHGRRPAAHGPPARGGPALHRHAAAAPGADARPCWSTPAPTPSARPPCWCSSPRWRAAYVSARFGTASPDGGAPVDRRGADEGHAARQGDPRAAGRRRPGRRLRVRGEPRGPRPVALAGRRHRDRRLHRQRRAQGPGGLAAVPLRHHARHLRHRRRDQGGGRGAAARTCSRWRPSSSPRTPAGPCCSGPTACASSATARRTQRP